MKKFSKIFSSICLVLVLGVAVLFAGCAKKPRVEISVTTGGGVYVVGESTSAIGSHAVDSGENYRFNIIADSGYYIAGIKVNGEDVDISGFEKNKEGYLVDHLYVINNVESDVTVFITFAPCKYNLRIVFSDGKFLTYKNVEYKKQFTLFKYEVEGKSKSFYYNDINGKAHYLGDNCLFTMGGKNSALYAEDKYSADFKTRLDAIFTDYEVSVTE